MKCGLVTAIVLFVGGLGILTHGVLLGIGKVNNDHAVLRLEASGLSRFGVSDATELADGLRAWLVHDRKHADQCVLVVHLGSSLTSQPWRCD